MTTWGLKEPDTTEQLSTHPGEVRAFVPRGSCPYQDRRGNSLSVGQCLGLGAFSTPGSSPGWGTKIPQAVRHSQEKKRGRDTGEGRGKSDPRAQAATGDGGRAWSDAVATKEGGGPGPPPESRRGAWPCRHLDLGIAASRTEQQRCLLFKPPSL